MTRPTVPPISSRLLRLSTRCIHACHYCYARATHSFFGLNADLDTVGDVDVLAAGRELQVDAVLDGFQRVRVVRLQVGALSHVEPEALALIARQATGSLRDAISLLDQLASTGQASFIQQHSSILWI